MDHDDLCTQIFPDVALEKHADTDEDAQTQVIDEEMPVSAAAQDRVISTESEDGIVLAEGAQANMDDLCTQVFNADGHVVSHISAAETGKSSAKPLDSADDLQTQIFDELPGKIGPLNDGVRKGSRRGNRAKGMAGSGARKAEGDNLDSLETQVFDGFVPPAPPSGRTVPFQSDKVADDSVVNPEMVIGLRRGRRMSLKNSHRESSDLTSSDKPATVASASDTSPESNTLVQSADDLATQAFDGDAAAGSIAVTDSLDCLATQTFDSVPSVACSTGPQENINHPTVSSGSNTNAEDTQTQVFDAVDPDERNAVPSRSSEQNSESANTGRRTSRASGRGRKKSVGRKQAVAEADRIDDLATQVFDTEPCGKQKSESSSAGGKAASHTAGRGTKRQRRQMNSVAEADLPADGIDDLATQVFDTDPCDKQNSELSSAGRRALSHTAGEGTKRARRQVDSDLPADGIDDLATQVFDTEPCDKLSKDLDITRPEAGADNSNARKSRASRAKPGSRSEAATEADEETEAEKVVKDAKPTVTDEASKPRRLSSRAGRGKPCAREASLSSVPEDAAAGAGKPAVGRSQGKRASEVQLLSEDVVKPDDSKTSSFEVSGDDNTGKLKLARSQARRGKQTNQHSIPDETSEPPSDINKLPHAATEGTGKTAARRRNKKEAEQPNEASRAAQSRLQSDEQSASDTDGAEMQVEKPVLVAEIASKTATKRECRKTIHKLYTAKGLHIFVECSIFCAFSALTLLVGWQGSFVLLYFRLSTFLICIEFVYLYFPVLFCLSVSVK